MLGLPLYRKRVCDLRGPSEIPKYEDCDIVIKCVCVCVCIRERERERERNKRGK